MINNIYMEYLQNYNNKNVTSLSEVTKFETEKKWKGGRLKERFNTHAQMIGRLTISSFSVVEALPMTCWLSSFAFEQRFPEGERDLLRCSKHVIGKRIFRRRK